MNITTPCNINDGTHDMATKYYSLCIEPHPLYSTHPSPFDTPPFTCQGLGRGASPGGRALPRHHRAFTAAMSPSRGLASPAGMFSLLLITLVLAAGPGVAHDGLMEPSSAAAGRSRGAAGRRELAQRQAGLSPLLTTARRLAQLLPPGGGTKYAPCTDSTEHTCSGTGGSRAICCNKLNFICGTLTTGGPRCATCPSICPTCLPGRTCLKDHNGCYDCLVPCSDATQCYSHQICAPAHPTVPGTYCRTNPCATGEYWNPCTANGTRCELTANYTPHCLPVIPPCTNDTACDSGEFCANGTCLVHPCTNVTCPTNQRCVKSTNNTAQCVPIGSGATCNPACVIGFACQQQGAGRPWKCVKVHVRRPPRKQVPVRRASVRRNRSQEAAATAAAQQAARQQKKAGRRRRLAGSPAGCHEQPTQGLLL